MVASRVNPGLTHLFDNFRQFLKSLRTSRTGFESLQRGAKTGL